MILALDVGRARIGVARGQRGSALVFGRGWLERRGVRADVEAVKDVAAREGAALVVVGLPQGTRGTDSAQTRLARDFASALERAGVCVALEDERFTTALAQARLRQAPSGRGRRAKGALDEASAVLILESYLQRAAADAGGSPPAGTEEGAPSASADGAERDTAPRAGDARDGEG